MTTERKEFSSVDAAPAVLYAKRDADAREAYPLLADAFGNILVTAGLVPSGWDYVNLNPPAQPTTITFKKGGSGGTTLATLTLTYSGSDIATVTRS